MLARRSCGVRDGQLASRRLENRDITVIASLGHGRDRQSKAFYAVNHRKVFGICVCYDVANCVPQDDWPDFEESICRVFDDSLTAPVPPRDVSEPVLWNATRAVLVDPDVGRSSDSKLVNIEGVARQGIR